MKYSFDIVRDFIQWYKYNIESRNDYDLNAKHNLLVEIEVAEERLGRELSLEETYILMRKKSIKF